MIPVFQNYTVENDGFGNCFNAAIASILELPLRSVLDINQNSPGSWIDQWKIWLADKGYCFKHHSADNPPKGFSIATVYTELKYPEGHSRQGESMAHSCVAFNGVIVHDPYPLVLKRHDLRYFYALVPLTKWEKQDHEKRSRYGRCIHGYRGECAVCPTL